MASMTGDDERSLIVVVEPEDVEYVRGLAAEHGLRVDEIPVRGLEPVLTVTLALLGGATVVSLVSQLIEEHKGGQVIDLRPSSPKPFYRTKDLIFGLVVILAQDGTVTVEVKEPRGSFGQVLEALKSLAVELAGSSSEEVAQAAQQKVGDAAFVTTAPEITQQ